MTSKRARAGPARRTSTDRGATGPQPLKVLLLIRSFGSGGAERQLVELARALKQRGCSVTVAAFYAKGPWLRVLQDSSVPIVDLGKKGRWDVIGFWRRLRRCICAARPDVIYSFLGGANVFSALVRPFVPKGKLVWSIRASDMDLAHYDWGHRFGYAIERRLSRRADLIIANSKAGMKVAAANGFPSSRIEVVPNGIDTEAFRPDASCRRSQRQKWGIGDAQIAVGMLARLDPMKGHRHFLEAAGIASAMRGDLRFVCIGDGPERGQLTKLAADLGLSEFILFPGPSQDSATALNGLDIFCSASVWGEGFSNAVAEAMACGLRCVVTDAGDSAFIVGKNGIVVPPADPHALAQGILDQVAALGGPFVSGRARIVDNFSIDRMADSTLELLERAAGSGSAAPR